MTVGQAFEPWRRTRVWFQYPRFLNAGQLVKVIRFAAASGEPSSPTVAPGAAAVREVRR